MDADEIEQVRQTNILLNLWLTKESSNENSLCDVFEAIKADLKDKEQGLRLTLVGTAIGMPKEKQLEFAADLIDSDSVEAELFGLLFGPEPMTRISPRLLSRLSPLWAAQYAYTRMNPQTNFIAAACEAVSGFLRADIAAKHLFCLQLFSLDNAPGPFGDHIFNVCRFVQDAPTVMRLISGISFRKDSMHIQGLSGMREVLEPISERGPSLDTSDMSITTELNYDYPDSDCLLETGAYTPVFTTVCKLLKLEPRAQWFEALRVDFLPRLKYRVPKLNGNRWKELEASFNHGVVSEGDEFLAAWLVIFDAWLHLLRAYNSPNNSPFTGLVTLTRNSTAPTLKVAHCFREQVLGDRSRITDFWPLLQSLNSTLQEAGLTLSKRYVVMRPSKKVSKKSRKKQSKKTTKKK